MVDRDKLQLDPREFSKIKLLGRGQYGEVYHNTHPKFGNVAIKQMWSGIIPSHEKQLESLMDEAKILGRLKNKYIVELFGIILQNDNCSLVLEYMSNGNLLGFLQKGSGEDLLWPLRARIILDVIEGMLYVHGQKIIHQDLKPENVLVDDNFHAKIADFGVSICKTWSQLGKEEQIKRSLTSGDTKKKQKLGMGTAAYMAPERLRDINYQADEKTDVYSFAILIWVILTQREPYENVQWGPDTSYSMLKLCTEQGQRPDEHKIPHCVPYRMVNIMKICWNQQPEERLSFSKCKEEYEPFYNGFFEAKIPDAVQKMKMLLDGEPKMRQKMSDLHLDPQSQSSLPMQSGERHGGGRSSNRSSQDSDPTSPVSEDGLLSADCGTQPVENEEPPISCPSEDSFTFEKLRDEQAYHEKSLCGNQDQPSINKGQDFKAVMDWKVSNRPFEDTEEHQRLNPVPMENLAPEATSSRRANSKMHHTSPPSNAAQRPSSRPCSEWQIHQNMPVWQQEDSQCSGAIPAAIHNDLQFSPPSTNMSVPQQEVHYQDSPASETVTATPSGPIPEHPRFMRTPQQAPMGPDPRMQPHIDWNSWPFNGRPPLSDMGSIGPNIANAIPGFNVQICKAENVQVGHNNVMTHGSNVKQPSAQPSSSSQSHISHSYRPPLSSFAVAGLTRQVTANDVDIIKRYLGDNWKDCARQLGLENGKISAISFDYNRDGQQEMIVQMLHVWRNALGRMATVNVLAKALYACGCCDILEALQ